MNVLLVQHAAQIVVDGVWQGLLVALFVGLALRLLPGISAAQRFAVWALAFGLAVGLPLLPALHAGAAGAAGGVRLGVGWGVALAMLWAATFAVRASRLAAQALRVRRVWASARPVETDLRIAALLAECSRRPQLCVSDEVDAPSVVGLLTPRLLLPTAMRAELSAAELRHIVLHECEHLRRYDDWLNLAQKVAMAVFPLNPALLWVDRRLGLERELACDAGVVAATGAALDYASCLARLAEHRLGRGRVALALSAWARRSELARRVYTLVQPVKSVSRMGARAAIAAVACLLLATADGIVHAPALVSFGPAAVPVVAAGFGEMSSPPVVPVVFRPAAPQAHATLVSAKTYLPVRKPVRVRKAVRPAGVPQGFITVSVPRRVVPAYAVPVRFTYSYAAVPFGDGWLIVQL